MTVFQRAVQLRVGPLGAPGIQLGNEEPGVTGHHIQFSTRASDTGRPAECDVTVYNVTDKSISYFEDGKNVALLRVGHRDRGLGTLFTGNPVPATMRLSREGGDWAFSVTLMDGGRALAYGRMNVAFGSTTSASQVLDRILSETGLGRGEIDLPGFSFQRRFATAGPARDALDLLVRTATMKDGKARRWFVRDGNLYVLRNTQTTQETAVVYSSDDGTLIGSPVPSDKNAVEFTGLLIDTTVRVGRIVHLKSRFISGFFKVVSVSFRGSNYNNDFYARFRVVPYR